MNTVAVFHFHLTQIMQMWPPSSVLLEIFRDSLRQQDMTGITTIHQSLGDINPDPGRIDTVVDVGHRAHWPAVHAHPDRQIAVVPQNPADFHGTLDRLLWTVIKNERHSVAGRNLLQSSVGRCLVELFRIAAGLAGSIT